MTGYAFHYDEPCGVLAIRVDLGFPDILFDEYCAALRATIAAARRHGPLRLLSDNRNNKIFGPIRSEILWTIVSEHADPRDRIALLVANSLAKLQARDQAGARAQTFASENAACTWLGAGSSLAA